MLRSPICQQECNLGYRNMKATLHSRCLNSSKGWRCKEPKSPPSNFCKKHNHTPSLPPPLNQPSFKLHQIVDAFYSDGWWKGEIVAYLHELDLYTVYFKGWDLEIHFSVDELRLHQICLGSKWVSQIMGLDVRRHEIDSQSDERKKKTRQSLPRERPWKKMQKEYAREVSSSEVASRTLLDRTKTGLCTTNFMESDFNQWNDGNESEEDLVRNKKDTGHDSTDILTNLCTTNFMELDFNQWDSVCESEEIALVQKKVTGHDSTDILTNTCTINCIDSDFDQLDGGRESEEEDLVQDTGYDFTDILTNTCTTNCMDSDFSQLDDGRESEEEDLVQDTGHDFTDVLTNPSIELTNYQTPNVCQKDSDFPFIKSLRLWKSFETMEVFLSMPQKPHFRPLAKVNKSLREGTAIGYMASFVTVVENTRNTLLSASVYDYVEALKSVKELEDMGFDVQLIRARMNKLLSIKTATLKLDAELKQVETQINKDKLKEESLQSDISEMDKNIAELHERSVKMKKMKQVILMKRLAKESNITVLQKSIQTSEEELRDTVLRFNSAAACPW